MPDPVNLGFALNLSPEKAIDYFERKGYEISFRWQDVWAEAHRQSFTAAGAMKMDVLTSIREELDDAMNNGLTFRQFREELEPRLKKQGWWGRTEIVDPKTGEIRQIDVTPWRLRNIYNTNLRTSFEAGRYQRQVEAISSRPYWMYVAVGDSNTRPSHADMDGTVLPADDPWWDENYPPNDWGCRCKVRSLSQRALERRGLSVQENSPDSIAGNGWDYNPGKKDFKPNLRQYPKDLRNQYKEAQKNYEPPGNP